MSTVRQGRAWRHDLGRGEPVGTAGEGAGTDPRQLRLLGIAAAAEATTLLLLVGVAVPLKHLGDWPLAVRVLGPLHGLAFVAYLWLVLQSVGAGLWTRGEAARLLLAAVVPFAGFLAARAVARRAARAVEDRPGA
ncbi:hypothetical protein OPKNFCMD_5517 [Methylobacterium crusticola]|uniref:DUF3817 domain-containing protein n=1 Tax=Methylobacterium crusticola TaxID=1697972 RepID=A0ABQ4R753_9HYPH|nr:DUF3817 domain-containing protein [Methylobacterium crusticola]GJD52750.1 hypothetical protein OPKNFCMD_5517 [Methylobacterium crusticola]